MTNLAVIDSFDLYKQEVLQIPLLTEEEEHRLAVDYYENGNIKSAQNLVVHSLRYVIKVAGEYKKYELPMADMVQEGNVGLMMAVRKFNPYKGIRLVTYAVYWIRAYIMEHIRSTWSLVKIGTNALSRKLFFGTERHKESLQHSDAEIYEMEIRKQREFSLNEVREDGLSHLDALECSIPNQEQLLIGYESNTSLQSAVENVLAGLNEREKYIVEHRLMADEKKTFAEIAEVFGVSREAIRQSEERLIKRLKESLNEYAVPLAV